MDKNTIIRLGALLFALLNLVLTTCGVNPIPVSDEIAYEIISIAVTIGIVIWNAWKNNNFTPAARAGQKVIDAIKSGRVSADKIEMLLVQQKEE